MTAVIVLLAALALTVSYGLGYIRKREKLIANLIARITLLEQRLAALEKV